MKAEGRRPVETNGQVKRGEGYKKIKFHESGFAVKQPAQTDVFQ